MKSLRKLTLLVALSAVCLAGITRSAFAAPITIDFAGTSGGLISYLGGSTALVGSNLPIGSVVNTAPGSTPIIFTGLMNFTTGNFISGTSSSGGQFINTYGSGGTFSITGGISSLGIAAGSTLMTATFATNPSFLNLGVGNFGTLGSGLNVNYLNPTLLAALGGVANFTGTGVGALTQLQLGINPLTTPFAPGVGFTASQSSANIAATLPVPTSLLLLGSGLTLLGFFGMKKPRPMRTGSSETSPIVIE